MEIRDGDEVEMGMGIEMGIRMGMRMEVGEAGDGGGKR